MRDLKSIAESNTDELGKDHVCNYEFLCVLKMMHTPQ